MNEKRKQELIGTVVGDKADKTITVRVDYFRKDPIYNKRIRRSKKFAAHDPENQAHVGDRVKIVMTRPLSKTKRYELAEIIEKAVIL